MRALFDTNVVIDLLAGYPPALTEAALYQDVAISRITWMEVLVGAPDAPTQTIWESFLSQFEMVELDESISRAAIQLRQQYRVKLPDALIWASALQFGANLVTRNTRDFKPGTQGIRIPYQR
jgi:predicted nucleic acid-binding protein